MNAYCEHNATRLVKEIHPRNFEENKSRINWMETGLG